MKEWLVHLSFEIVALGFSAHGIWFVSSAHCASLIQFGCRGFPDFLCTAVWFSERDFSGKSWRAGFLVIH